jgi:hypothetical protein
MPYRHEGEGDASLPEQACPDYLIVFPRGSRLTARTDRFTPIHRVRLAHNTVAGAEEMVVYETVWARGHEGRRACPAGEATR